jgi:signal transduction histidine kinase
VRWAVVEVEDTGPGIPGEIIHKIFDPFFTTKEKGTGLGLSIVHRLMEEMGGRVEVRSQEGVGAKFTLWIPARPPTSSNGGHGEEWS